jgi:hypothetical protein
MQATGNNPLRGNSLFPEQRRDPDDDRDNNNYRNNADNGTSLKYSGNCRATAQAKH